MSRCHPKLLQEGFNGLAEAAEIGGARALGTDGELLGASPGKAFQKEELRTGKARGAREWRHLCASRFAPSVAGLVPTSTLVQ